MATPTVVPTSVRRGAWLRASLFLFVAVTACTGESSLGSGTGGTSGATGGTTGLGGGNSARGGGPSTGGSSAAGTSGPTLEQSCAAICAAQEPSACASTSCQADCVAAAARSPGTASCKSQYTAMAQCEAGLASSKWTCSSDENVPIPVDGQCTSSVCAWACCATDLIVPSDIWARCMDGCQPGGAGGTVGSAGDGGTGPGGASGKAGTGGGGAGTGGSPDTGGTGGSPGPGIPPGYPAPSAETAAKCTTVPMSGSYCPGGGPGPTCIQCLFGGTTYNKSETPPPPADATALAGDYLVTVQLGGQGPAYVSAESSRGLLAQGAVSTTYGFVVDVRGMEGQPNHSGGAVGYSGLDLFFSGPAGLKISGIGYGLATPATKPVMVYVAGDSTVCDQTGNDYAGWGQMLPQYFKPPMGIANYANSGASSSSFYSAFWGQIKAKWKAGDWVLIQFGHNDKNVSDATVQANLEKYVSDAQAANVTPILISPPARVQFSGSTVSDQSSLHAAAAKAAAAAKGCAYIDLTALSVAWYNSLGSSSAALKFHALGSDVTHTNLAGADKLASLIAGAIKMQNIALMKYLR
jgi:lysophospholipase L1-like esterase